MEPEKNNDKTTLSKSSISTGARNSVPTTEAQRHRDKHGISYFTYNEKTKGERAILMLVEELSIMKEVDTVLSEIGGLAFVHCDFRLGWQ